MGSKTAGVHSIDKVDNSSSIEKDVEQNQTVNNQFINDNIHVLSWNNLSVELGNSKSKSYQPILSSTNGYVEAGQVLALMGPSGSGKTIMLHALAHRTLPRSMKVNGSIHINGQPTVAAKLSQVARYVEQDDALIGSLTVKESVEFTARLSLPSSITKLERIKRVDDALTAFGIQDQAHLLIGTPLRKGISGGQKKRVSVASQLVTSPRILFLDEPTSGLDSAASREVMSYISNLAKELKLLVIISIHQPSTTTFELFDQVLLLSAGQPCFFGPREELSEYFQSIGHSIPLHTNPAEFLLDLVNIDFARDKQMAKQHLNRIHESWSSSIKSRELQAKVEQVSATSAGIENVSSWKVKHGSKPNISSLTLTLLRRAFIKSYRDMIAYQVRIAMYTALAIMMGTVWLRLPYTQESIQTFINAIFFSGAFMSFMAVAYIPAYIEDLNMMRKERANGLYGPLPFMLANFLIGLPYLLLISILFSVIAYWLVNLQPTADSFWLWTLYLFLDLLAAEGLVILISSLMPIFVVALAVTAFANGLWMCVGGFLVPPGTLNVFWKCRFSLVCTIQPPGKLLIWVADVFHYIDYQAWVTQALIINQFKYTTYHCSPSTDGGYNCMYPSDLMTEGKIRGTAVIEAYRYGYNNGENGRLVGIMIGIIFAYRLFGYMVLVLKRA